MIKSGSCQSLLCDSSLCAVMDRFNADVFSKELHSNTFSSHFGLSRNLSCVSVRTVSHEHDKKDLQLKRISSKPKPIIQVIILDDASTTIVAY